MRAETEQLLRKAREAGRREGLLERDIKALYIEARDAGINPDRLDHARALGKGDSRRDIRRGEVTDRGATSEARPSCGCTEDRLCPTHERQARRIEKGSALPKADARREEVRNGD